MAVGAVSVSRNAAYVATDNTTTKTWANANYIPELYSKKVLYDFWAQSVYNEVTNTDYENEFKNQGDKIQIRQAPQIAVGTYTVGTGGIDKDGAAITPGILYQTPAVDSTYMVIDQALYTAWRCDDIDKVQSDISLLDMYATDSANRLRIAVDTDVLDAMGDGAHASNKGTAAGAISSSIDLGDNSTPETTNAIAVTSANAITKIVECNQCLDEQNINNEGRFIVIPSWYAALLKLGDLKRADITGDSSGVIRNGKIGMVDNTMVYVNNNLNSNTDGNSNTGFEIIAGTKEATSFAMQISKSDNVPIPDSFGEYVRTLWVYGRKVLRPEALVNLFAYKG